MRGLVLLALLWDGDDVLAGDVASEYGQHFHGIGCLVEGLFDLADGGFSHSAVGNDPLHGGEELAVFLGEGVAGAPSHQGSGGGI